MTQLSLSLCLPDPDPSVSFIRYVAMYDIYSATVMTKSLQGLFHCLYDVGISAGCLQ